MKKRHFYLFIPLVIIAAFFKLGCVSLPSNPVMPQWDVDLNVPIVNRSYVLNDIVKQQNYISIQDSGTANNIYLIQSQNYSISKDVSSFTQALGTASTSANIVSGAGKGTLFVQFPAGATISNAVFSSGILTYSFQNPSVQVVTITLEIPGISINGTTFSTTFQVAPNSTATNKVDFTGAIYAIPANQPSIYDNSLEIIIGATSNTVTPLGLTLTTSDFYFSSATGYIPAKSLGIKSNEFSLNLSSASNYRNKINLKNASLNLDATYIPAASNNNPFQIEVKNLTIIGIRNDGTQLALVIPDSAKTFIFSGTVKHFDFDSTNSNITKLISFLPDSISVSAEYIMNPNNLTGTVAAGDSVKFSANFSTTSFMAIGSTSTTNTSDMGNISSADRNKIKASQSAYISVNIQNGIPLESSLSVVITDSLNNPLFTLTNSTTNADSFVVAPATVDQNGNVTAPGTTSLTIQLDSTQTNLLSQAYHAITTVSVQTPNNPTPVAIRPNDSIQIQVYGGVKFRINKDNLK